MNARDPFLTEEFLRYGAECRRMAGLARRQKQSSAPSAQSALAGTAQRSAAWLGQIRMRYASLPKRQRKLPTGWSHTWGLARVTEP